MRHLSVLPATALLATALLPAFAQASIWTLEYSATLTDRHTEGFDVPDSLHGVLTFDLDATTNVSNDSWDARYKFDPEAGGGNFVHGYIPQEAGGNSDYLDIYNGDDPANPEPWVDVLGIEDSALIGDYYEALSIYVEPDAGSWLDDTTLKEFSFNAEQLRARPGRSTAELIKMPIARTSNGGYYQTGLSQEAWYDLDYVKLTDTSKPVTTPVPEPGTLLMMLTGLFSLSIFKTRAFSGNKKRA